MKNFRGLFVGLNTIDIQYFVDSFQAANKKVKTTPPEILVGVPATNAAVAFSYLNKNAFLITATGNNSFLAFIENDFKSIGIQHFDLTGNQQKNQVIFCMVHFFTTIYPPVSIFKKPLKKLRNLQPFPASIMAQGIG